jgi:hypothetical protein
MPDGTVIKNVYDEPESSFPKHVKITKLDTKHANWNEEIGSGVTNVLGWGHMWKNTLPKVGERFAAYFDKLNPTCITSSVQKIVLIEMNKIVIETTNSTYEITWKDKVDNENN